MLIFRHVGNDDLKNKSVIYQTILANQVCVTYDPPAKSDVTQGIEPVNTQWP